MKVNVPNFEDSRETPKVRRNWRSSNALDNSIAKESLAGFCNFYFDDFNLDLLSSVFLNLAVLDQLVAARL